MRWASGRTRPALADRLRGGATDAGGGRTESRSHRGLRLWRLHRFEQRVEARLEVSQSWRARAHQGLELLVRDEHGLGRIVLGDGDRLAQRGLLEHRGEFVLEARRGHPVEVDELALGVAEFQRIGHWQSPLSVILAIIAISWVQPCCMTVEMSPRDRGYTLDDFP